MVRSLDLVITKHLFFVVPGDISSPTGGYIYDRRIIQGLTDLGWQVELVSLGDGFPFPDDAVRKHACEMMRAIPAGYPIVMDGLAYAVLPELALELSQRYPLIALVHHPLALESGLSNAQSSSLKESEIVALSHATHVIVTSPATARNLIEDFGVSPESVSVVLPGTDRIALAPIRSHDGLNLLSVGSIVPRKGFDVLIEALSGLKDLPWQLTIAGDRTRDAQAPLELDRDIDRFGLASRVKILGAVSPEVLEDLYLNADLFVLASRFEGYGMAFAEALAHGLPVVGTTGGAIPDTVPAQAGILVEPGCATQLAQALRRILTDPDLRLQLSLGARDAALNQPRWQDSAQLFSDVLEQLLA